MLLDGLQYITASHHWRFAYAAKCRFWLRLQCASSAQTSCFSASNFAVVVWEGGREGDTGVPEIKLFAEFIWNPLANIPVMIQAWVRPVRRQPGRAQGARRF